MLPILMDRRRSEFERFLAEVEPRVRRALVGGFGAMVGRQAASRSSSKRPSRSSTGSSSTPSQSELRLASAPAHQGAALSSCVTTPCARRAGGSMAVWYDRNGTEPWPIPSCARRSPSPLPSASARSVRSTCCGGAARPFPSASVRSSTIMSSGNRSPRRRHPVTRSPACSPSPLSRSRRREAYHDRLQPRARHPRCSRVHRACAPRGAR
jgi:hypothetical protein